MTDLWLAIAHHALVFGLTIMLAMEAALLRDSMTGRDALRLAGLDMGYGITALLIIVIGILRVIYGLKGAAYYTGNVWFWAKMATFALIGILSVPPTLRFLAWRKAARADANFVPPAAEIRTVRNYVRTEVRLIIAVAAFAAIMARYRGL